MPMSLPGDAADRIRRIQQMRAGYTPDYAPDAPSIQQDFTLDMSPHETDMASQSPIPGQDELDGITRQMQGYSYNPQSPIRDETGALSHFPKYEKIAGYRHRR